MQSDAASSSELRRQPRHRAFLAGRLAYGDPQITTACTIRSLSATGAAIELQSAEMVPVAVQLLNAHEATVYEARVVWRRNLRLGLNFTACHDLRQPVEPQLRALQAIWKELAPR